MLSAIMLSVIMLSVIMLSECRYKSADSEMYLNFILLNEYLPHIGWSHTTLCWPVGSH
jgi:hypothetical protein